MNHKHLVVVVLLLLAACVPVKEEVPLVHRLYAPVVTRHYKAPVFSEKKGIGLQYDHCEDVARVGAGWSYNWFPQTCCEGIPMIFQPGEYGILLYGDKKHLLVFNELDRPRWYHTPYEAARAWHEIESMYPNRLLIGPAVSHLGLPWLLEFHDTYVALYGKEPYWYALAVHCYANTSEGCREVVQQVIDWADEWEVVNGVWVTEFAFNPNWEWGDGSMEDATRFVRWMEANPRVPRYAWFTNRTSGKEEWAGSWTPLFEYDTGNVTDWGRWYGGTK